MKTWCLTWVQSWDVFISWVMWWETGIQSEGRRSYTATSPLGSSEQSWLLFSFWGSCGNPERPALIICQGQHDKTTEQLHLQRLSERKKYAFFITPTGLISLSVFRWKTCWANQSFVSSISNKAPAPHTKVSVGFIFNSKECAECVKRKKAV